MAKLPSMTSPIVEWRFPWITVKKTRFDADGEYTVDMVFDSEDHPFLQKVAALMEDAFEDAIKAAIKAKIVKPAKAKKAQLVVPWKPEEDEDGEETGRFIWPITTKAVVKSRKTGNNMDIVVKVFDASTPPKNITNKKLKIGSGTKGRVSFSYVVQFVKITGNVHMTTYLNAVQVVELAEFGYDAGSYGFDGEEGRFDGDDVETNEDFQDEEFDGPADEDLPRHSDDDVVF